MTVEPMSSAHTLTIWSVSDQPHSVLRVSTIASPRPSGSSGPGATIRGTLNVVPTAFETVRRSRPVPRWRLNSIGGKPCCTAFVTSSDATSTASSGSRHEVSALATMRRATPGAVVSGGRVQLPAGSMVKVYPTAPNLNHRAFRISSEDLGRASRDHLKLTAAVMKASWIDVRPRMSGVVRRREFTVNVDGPALGRRIQGREHDLEHMECLLGSGDAREAMLNA